MNIKKNSRDVILYALGVLNYIQFVVFQLHRRHMLRNYASPCLFDTAINLEIFLLFPSGCDAASLVQSTAGDWFVPSTNSSCVPEEFSGRTFAPCGDDAASMFSYININDAGVFGPYASYMALVIPIMLAPVFFARNYIKKRWILPEHVSYLVRPSRTVKIVACVLLVAYDLLYTNVALLMALNVFFPFERRYLDNAYSFYSSSDFLFSVMPSLYGLIAFVWHLCIAYYAGSHLSALAVTALKNDWPQLRNMKNMRMRIVRTAQKGYSLLVGVPMMFYLISGSIGLLLSESGRHYFTNSLNGIGDLLSFKWGSDELKNNSVVQFFFTNLITMVACMFSIFLPRCKQQLDADTGFRPLA